MAYSFDPDATDLSAEVRRIALDQIDRGLSEAVDQDLPLAERVHQLRKRCKKLRGLIRLVRPGFPAYAKENAAFRDTARTLSDVRDAGALVETCDALTAHFDDQLYARTFAGIRARFAEAARATEDAEDVPERLDRARGALSAARERAAAWRIEEPEQAAVEDGLAKTYGRARKAMAAARTAPTGEALHEWRKRVKYHWYHLRLLKSASPLIKPQIEAAGELSDILGDHHDLHVMAHEIGSVEGIADAEIEAFRGLMLGRQEAMEATVFRLGRVLFCEKPGAIAGRMGTYLQSNRDAAGN